jgi:hypothetical protein
MWRTCVSIVFGVTQSRSAVGEALRHQREHLSLSIGQLFEWIRLAAAGEELRDELVIDDSLARGDAPKRRGELASVQHPVLEQVAAPSFRAVD